MAKRATEMTEMTNEEKKAFLERRGWTVGARDPRLNTDYPGEFMAVEPHEESELPTRDGANGPWCVVGNDLPVLVDEAYAFQKTAAPLKEKHGGETQ
jgi:hypothetical protein